MPSLDPSLPGAVEFGSVANPLPEWRDNDAVAQDDDPDDKTMPETPADVTAILGFDPLELE
jgi:hypothetical protein